MSRRALNVGTPTSSPLSSAVIVGQLVFVSGQTAPEEQGIEAQTRAVLKKVGDVLRAAGSGYAHVARCGVYLSDIGDFPKMNAVYREFFSADHPARSTLGCALARPDVLVEIDCVAEVPTPAS